jgi:CBS domain containing-hemolysin-like protein
MTDAGDRLSKLALKALDNLDRYISATQLGITIASLALGWVGEPVVAALIDAILGLFGIEPTPGATHTAAGIAVGFAVITFLHVVFGELAPKTIALVMPERLSGWVSLPLMLFARLMMPFIALLNGTANASLRVFGIADGREPARTLAGRVAHARHAGTRPWNAGRERYGHARRGVRLP